MKTFKVLIVEDAPFIREILILYFEKIEGCQFDIQEAENGDEGFEKYISFQPDLIFMDIVMPVVSGIECTKKIRSLNPKVPILGLSTLNDGPTIDKLMNAGATTFIQKPFTVTDLDTALVEYLN